MPASFTNSGVGKSGSPGPRSTTSIPRARMADAARKTPSVADGEMDAARRAIFNERAPLSRRSEREKEHGLRGARREEGAPARGDPHDLERAPRAVDPDHRLPRGRRGELDHPKHEEDACLGGRQVQVQEEEPGEEALENRQQDLL